MFAILLWLADLVLPAAVSAWLRSLFDKPKAAPLDPLARVRAATEAEHKIDTSQEAIERDPNNRDNR